MSELRLGLDHTVKEVHCDDGVPRERSIAIKSAPREMCIVLEVHHEQSELRQTKEYHEHGVRRFTILEQRN